MILLLIGLAELPVMVLAWRRRAQSRAITHSLIAAVSSFCALYVAIDAATLALLIDVSYSNFGVILATLGTVRVGSGILTR